jgi:hypothetical protein
MPQRRRANITNFKVRAQSTRGTTEEMAAAFKKRWNQEPETAAVLFRKLPRRLGLVSLDVIDRLLHINELAFIDR